MIDSLNNYFMKPTKLSNGLNVYPVKLMQYERFKELAMTYLVIDIKEKNNLLKQQWEKNRKRGIIKELETIKEDNLFDWLVNLINSSKEGLKEINQKKEILSQISEEDLKELIKDSPELEQLVEIINQEVINIESEMLELLEILLHNKVVFDGTSFFVLSEGEVVGELNREVFYEFRNIVMTSNLLHTPKIVSDLYSQKVIDRAIQSMSKNGINEDLASVCSVIKSEYKVTDEELMNYTYFRLRYDFEIANRKHLNMFIYMLRSQGCGEAEIKYLCETVDLYKDPYEGLFVEAQENELDKRMKKQ